ncbi:MAG: hypothetical protein GY757_37330, partial [bacterium]|nr:hypothetical protein [bacterium]
MKKTINRILLIFLIMTLAIVGTSPPLYADTTTPGTPPKLPPNILKLRDVKIGMEGEGKTIFKGTKIETFKFKVLGILEKYQPGKDMIIVELSESDVLAEAGIIAGMSGSPVYVDGKLMGAVAFGFNYSKKPIGGVTPIEDMINIDEHNRPTVSIDISDIRIDFSEKNLKSISNRLRQELAKLATFSPSKAFSPIKLIGHQKGMDPTSLSLLSPMFTPLNSLKIKSQPGNKLKINEDLFKISPADAASVVLVKGDFEYSASGTVTYVDGNKVYLFGHPYFNLGTVDFPMHKADVISVIPSYRESFKLVSTRSMIGSIIQDRSTAVQAELGRSPYMIPMKVFLQNRNKSFNVEIINHPLLTPALASISLESVFSAEYKDFGFQAIRVNG